MQTWFCEGWGVGVSSCLLKPTETYAEFQFLENPDGFAKVVVLNGCFDTSRVVRILAAFPRLDTSPMSYALVAS